MLDDFPGVSSFTDRHGKLRWRFRRKGRTVALPDPRDPGFAEAYRAAVENRTPRKAEIVPHPGATVPESFAAAWRLVQQTPEWLSLDPATRLANTRLAEGFLLSPVAPGFPDLWRDMLVRDLKRRGLLDETIVVWGGEFGRTPVSESGTGRDHNPYGFTMWTAGGGFKGGLAYGATDEFGFKAVENRVSIHDLHATMLHLLGFDHTRLTYRFGGRDMRLTDVHGHIVKDVLL